MNVLAGLGPAAFSVAELSDAGASRISLGSNLSRVAFGAFIRAAKVMQAEGTFDFSDEAASYPDLQAYMQK